jgi:hypothetical protein
MCDCNKNKYIINQFIDDKKIKENFSEDFSLEKPKDLCHYTCSEINMTNIILVILIIILIYLIVKK